MSTIRADSNGITSTPDKTGTLNVEASSGVVECNTTGSLGLPLGTTDQRINTNNVLRFNTTRRSLEYYNGTGWKAVWSDNVAPTWTTQSGTVATITDAYGSYSNIATLQATDPDAGQTLNYSITNGSLPVGVLLNSTTGVLSGDPNNVETQTTYSFDVTATDSIGATAVRTFSIIVNPAQDGATAARAASSAQAIKTLTGTDTDGVYYINLPTVGATPIYCIMNSAYNGGGWMMILKATRGTTFQYDSAHWTTVTTLNPTQTNQSDGDAKFHTMNYFAAKDMLARWPDIGAGGSISGLGNWIWLENNFYSSGTRIVPITLWSTANRNFIRDAKTFSGWASGVFSSQTDVRFYGFNYYNTPGWAKTRWGFGWNENGGGLFPNGEMGSDDVFGGIGMGTASWGGSNGYSAGDAIHCCQDTTGINRSARVEIYVR
jgi:hypothetical protein